MNTLSRGAAPTRYPGTHPSSTSALATSIILARSSRSDWQYGAKASTALSTVSALARFDAYGLLRSIIGRVGEWGHVGAFKIGQRSSAAAFSGSAE
ncbi:MAG: hypothetical protein WA441_12315 [Methyloceanibacter sp.]